MNLNNIKVHDEYSHPVVSQTDFSCVNTDGTIEVYFKDIEKHIIEKIRKYDNVVGCVAWLTNENILKELAHKKSV